MWFQMTNNHSIIIRVCKYSTVGMTLSVSIHTHTETARQILAAVLYVLDLWNSGNEQISQLIPWGSVCILSYIQVISLSVSKLCGSATCWVSWTRSSSLVRLPSSATTKLCPFVSLKLFAMSLWQPVLEIVDASQWRFCLGSCFSQQYKVRSKEVVGLWYWSWCFWIEVASCCY